MGSWESRGTDGESPLRSSRAVDPGRAGDLHLARAGFGVRPRFPPGQVLIEADRTDSADAAPIHQAVRPLGLAGAVRLLRWRKRGRACPPLRDLGRGLALRPFLRPGRPPPGRPSRLAPPARPAPLLAGHPSSRPSRASLALIPSIPGPVARRLVAPPPRPDLAADRPVGSPARSRPGPTSPIDRQP